MKQTIKYNIISCSSKQKFISVEGYAYSLNSNNIEFKIVDNDNNEIEIIYARKKIFSTGNDNKDYSGFFIKFNVVKGKKYFLILQNNITNIKISLLYQLTKHSVIKSFKYGAKLLKNSNFKSLFKNIFYIIKNKNNIDIKNVIDNFNNQYVSENELKQQQNIIFAYMPLVSIICNSVSNNTIESIKKQSYNKIEICRVDNNDINKLINSAKGDILVFVEAKTVLEPNTIFEIVKAFNIDINIDFVYCNEDKKTENSYEVNIKEKLNIDLLRTHNYIGSFFAVKKNIANTIDAFIQSYDYIFKCIEQSKIIYNVPKILVHMFDNQNTHNIMNKQIIENHLKRNNISATVLETKQLGYYLVDYKLQYNDFVSIIILNKDNKEQLEVCVNSILEKTQYQNYEIIIVENNSTSQEIFKYYKSLENNQKIKVVICNEKFNYSKLNNYAVKLSKGKYLLFLNNDTQVIEKTWLEVMLANCQRKEVGVVGAKLLYSNNTIQHYGVTFKTNNIAEHMFVNMVYNDVLNNNKLNLQQNVDAVTGACLMVSKELFNRVQGFDENLSVSFNDIDLCFKIKQLNKLIMIDPRILLYHYESKTRGYESTIDKIKRFEQEKQYYINKNLGVNNNN